MLSIFKLLLDALNRAHGDPTALVAYVALGAFAVVGLSLYIVLVALKRSE
jgi:hypothetical protein